MPSSPHTPPPSIRHRSIWGGVWAGIGAAGASSVSFVTFLVLSRILGPAIFGQMAMIETTLALGQQLMKSGLAEPLVQIREIEPEHADTLFWTLQAFSLVLIAGFALLSYAVESYFRQPGLAPLIWVASITLYLQSCGLVPGALLTREFRFHLTARASIASEIAGAAAGIAMAIAGGGIWALVLQRLVALLVETAMLWTLAGWRPRLRWSQLHFRHLWGYSASRGIEGLLHYADLHGPRLILGRVAGAAELGYFLFARRVIENTVNVLLTPVRTAAFPAFAELQQDLPRARRAYTEGVGLTTTIVIPACAGLALTAPVLVPLVAGADWHPAVLLLQLLALGAYRRPFHIWNAAMLRGLGRPQLLLAASTLRTVAMLAMVLLLIPYRAAGVAVGMLIGAYVSWPVAMRFVKKVTGDGMWQQLRPGVPPLAATLLMAVLLIPAGPLIAARLPPVVAMAALIAAGVATYALGLYAFGPMQWQILTRALATLRHGPRDGFRSSSTSLEDPALLPTKHREPKSPSTTEPHS